MPLAHPWLTLLGGLSLAAVLSTANAQDTTPEPVALVNGEPISQAVFDTYAAQRSAQVGDPENPEVRAMLLEELLVQQLLVAEATQRQLLDQDPALRLQQRNLLATAAIRQLMEEILPDEAAIEAEYQSLIDSQENREFEASHILVDDEALATQIIADLDTGSDFAELARSHSSDDTAEQGGYLDWFPPDVMVPAFGNAVMALAPESYTSEPVQTEFGWHVIFLHAVRESPPPPLESLRPRIVQQLQSQMINDYLVEQRQQADIQIRRP